MRKIVVLLWLITGVMFMTRLTEVKAYWIDNLDTSGDETEIGIQIGHWLGDILPGIIEGWNLDEWVLNNDLNHNIPSNQLFSYQGRIYISLDNIYNPMFHGLPGAQKLYWAYASTNMDWEPGYNYRTNSVVKSEDKYYISIVGTNWNVWDLSVTWAWREIEPIANNNFNKFSGTDIIDYASPDWNYIIYK